MSRKIMERFLKRKFSDDIGIESSSKNASNSIIIEGVDYESRIRLNTYIRASRLYLHQGLSFCGFDQSEESDHEKFLELIKLSARQNELISKVMLENDPRNSQIVSIQNDIAHCFAQEVVRSIIGEIGSDVFSLLVDDSRDVFGEEQLGVVLRYVDRHGFVKERFIGVVHVNEISSPCFKSSIDSLLAEYGLSLKNVRSQAYDGASDMRDEFDGLRALILKENSSAHYLHCFANQFHLIVLAIAKKNHHVFNLFDNISLLANVVKVSCQKKDMIQETYKEQVRQAIIPSEPSARKMLNQEISLQLPGNTCFSNEYWTLLCLFELFPTILEVLEYIESEAIDYGKRGQAYRLLIYFQTFDFVYCLQLMLLILGITDQLSMALQRKDQDILNAISMVRSTKQQLQEIKDGGWDPLWKKVLSFCEEHDISTLKFEEEFVNLRKPTEKTNITNLQHFQVDCFYTIVDLVLQELNDRFDEINIELLICMASLSPVDSFCNFDSLKLMRLVNFYPDDFSFLDRMTLEQQLSIYIDSVREDERFSNLKGLSDLARVMVDTGKHRSQPLVYRLLKLVLILPVATATVERCFSKMKIVKTYLQNRISNHFLNDCLVCYIENDVLDNVTDEVVIDRFQKN